MARQPRSSAPPASAVVVRRPDPKEAYQAIESAINAKRDAIVQTLVPTINPDRFISVALQAVTRSPKLLECTPASIVKALRDAAELGLEPSGLMGSAYLVPYRRNSKDAEGNWHSVMEAQLIPGYRGLIDLARRSGEVHTVEARVVRERDVFDFEYGTSQYVHHRPWLNLTNETVDDTDPETGEVIGHHLADAGARVALFALARLKSGETQFEVMTIPQVDAIRSRSKAADDGPWVTDYDEMARKTVVRRLLKYLPLSVVALNRALELEDAAESTAEQPVAVQPVARARLQAALLHPEDASGTDEADEVSEHTRDDANDAPDAPPTRTDDAEALCGVPSTWAHDDGSHNTCGLAPEHRGPHRTADGTESWPNS